MSFVTTEPEMLLSAQAVAMHELFATTLGAGAGSYAATEAANAVAASGAEV
jgi:hypothetical protein